MIAKKACYHEHCMIKISNKLRKFSNDQENYVKEVQKSLETITIVEYMSFIEDSLESIAEVAPFIKLSVSYMKLLLLS